MTTTTTIDVFFLFFHFHSRSPYQLGSPREPPGLCFTATSTIAVVGRGRRGRRRAPALYLLLLVLFPLVLFRGRAVAAHCGKKRTKRKSERRAERRKETNAFSKQKNLTRVFPRNSSAPARRLSLGSTLLDNARDLPPARQRQQRRRFSLRRAYAESRKPSID